MNKPTKPAWSEAARFIDALTCSAGEAVTIQLFADKGDDARLGEHRHVRLSDRKAQEWLIPRIKRGAGVFVTVNETDGIGRRSTNITAVRASFVDFDGTPLPAIWPLEPHIIVESSPGRYHAYWLLTPGADLEQWRHVQARLAAAYGGDPKVIDLPRVMRLPGFDHQKTEPFRSRIIKLENPPDFGRYSLQELEQAHPVAFQEPAKVVTLPATLVADIEWDSERGINEARSYLSLLVLVVGQRNNTAYAAAAKLNDLALTPDTALEMLGEWNASQDDPLPESEIEHVVRSASTYKQNPPGAGLPPTAEEDFADESAEAAADADEPDKPGDAFNRHKSVKLNDLDQYNIMGACRLVNLAGRTRVVWWTSSALDRRVKVPQFISPREFKLMLSNKIFTRKITVKNREGEKEEKVIRVNIADHFLRNPKRKVYDGVVLQAEMDSASPDAINLWRGYGVTASDRGSWSLLREHVRKIVANGKRDRDEYIIRWMAWAVQNPDKPAEVALILKSATHGTGKGFLFRTLRKLFGAHAMQVNSNGLLTGRFNAHLSTACLLFIDEMTLSDNKESAKLNSLLTEDALPIEPKGIDAFMMPNHLKVVASSNQEHVVMIAGSDRRFMVFQVSDARARDKKYFGAIQDQLDAGGYERMLYDLLEMDLGDWHPRDTAGVDDDKNPEKVRSVEPEIEWLAGYLEAGELDCQASHRGGTLVYASDFYDRARKTNRRLFGWSDRRFATFLDEWGIELVRSNGSKRQFPPLADLRAKFREKFPWWPAFDDELTTWHDATAGMFAENESEFG